MLYFYDTIRFLVVLFLDLLLSGAVLYFIVKTSDASDMGDIAKILIYLIVGGIFLVFVLGAILNIFSLLIL